jgi:hypothetical protein
MVGRVIRALIYLCVIALLFYLCLWVIGMLGIPLPGMVINILKVIFVLVAILVLYQLFAPAVSNYDWWGRNPNNPPGP